MEYWNDGILDFLKDIIPLLFFVKTKVANNPTFRFPKPIFPIFQSSNIPIGTKPLTCALIFCFLLALLRK